MSHFTKQVPAGDTKLRDVCARCGFIDYKNPRVVVGALAATDDHRIHLVERDGEWTLPYGFMKVGEMSKEGAGRLIPAAQSTVDHILTLDEMPDAGLVIMTFRARVGAVTEGVLLPLNEARNALSSNPAALHALDVYARTNNQSRFAPGFLRHSFDAAVLHMPVETFDVPRKPCGDCTFDKGGTVKLVAGVVPVHGNKVLLARRAIPPRIGAWTVPAGFMELNETLREGAVREALEETDATVEAGELLGIYEIPKNGQITMIFRGVMDAPHAQAGIESQEVRFFDWNDIPWNELAFPMVHEALTKYDRYKLADTVEPCHISLAPINQNKPPVPTKPI